MLTQCSRQFVLPMQHLWTLLAVLSTCSFISASCCYCKKRHWEQEFCVHVFMCLRVYANARLQALCWEANNKLSCWLLICMDKRSRNESHNASYLVHHLKEAATSVSHLQVSPWQAWAFVLKSWNNKVIQRWQTCTHAQPTTPHLLNIHYSPPLSCREKTAMRLQSQSRLDHMAASFHVHCRWFHMAHKCEIGE